MIIRCIIRQASELKRFFPLSIKDDCQNYIRVLAPTRDGRLLVCGTNAYNPKCRYYRSTGPSGDDAAVEREFSGKGLCPYDPRHNSTALYSGKLFGFSARTFFY